MRQRHLFKLLAFLLGFTAAFTVAATRHAHADPVAVTCAAHRGGETGHTEETIATYNQTLDAGVQVVEGDVWDTSTNAPVMTHDATLGLFGHPELDVRTLTQTQATSYTSLTGDHLATLWQVGSAIIAHPGSRLEAELKFSPTAAQWPTLDTRFSRIRDRLTITSFSPTTVQAIEAHGYRAALNTEDDVSDTHAPTVSQNADTIDAATVARLADVGVATEAFTPDTTAELNSLYAIGVRVFLTNKPLACLSWAAGE